MENDPAPVKTDVRNIALYLASQIMTLLGTSLVQGVMFWYITLETRSGTMMTVAMIAGFLPNFLVAPFAGVWADRFDRKKIIVLSDAFVAVATAALFVVFRLGFGGVWPVIIVMALRAVGQGIQQPAVGALLPQLVPQEHLMRVNSINSSAQSVMMLLTPALGGVLYTFFPIEITFAVDVATAAIAVAVLWFFVKIQAPLKTAAVKNGYFSDMKSGIRYVAKHKLIGRFMVYMIPLNILIAPVAVLFSLIIAERFGADAWRLSLNDSIFAVGMLGGSVLMMTWGGFRNRVITIAVGCMVMSAATILYGFIMNFWLFLAATVIVGLSIPLFNTPAVTLLQERADPAYLGRVMSLTTMLGSLGMPVGMLIFGPLADVIGLTIEFIATGAAMLVVSVIIAFDRTLRAAGRRGDIGAAEDTE